MISSRLKGAGLIEHSTSEHGSKPVCNSISSCLLAGRKSHSSLKRESGASLVEYGLLVALIAIVALSAVRLFGTNVSSSYSASTSALIAGGLG